MRGNPIGVVAERAATSLRSAVGATSRVLPTFESLEGRQFLSVSVENGYTVVTPGSQTRVVYVSNSLGDDANNGLSASSPVKSISKGKSLLRDGTGDQLLLKRGDVWTSGLGYWKISGQSPDQPLLIGAYGEGARPEIQNGTTYAFGAGTPSARLHDVVIQGISFYAVERDPNSPQYNATAKADGIYLAGNIENLTFEDMSVQYYTNNLVASNYYPHFKNLQIRQSNLSFAYSDGKTHSQGMYVEGVDGITLVGNTLDHNGWNEQLAGSKPTIFNHNAYIQAVSKNLVAKSNIFANASSHGLQARPGGVIEDNLFLNNPIGVTFGLVNGSGPLVAGGVTGSVSGNVFVGGRDISGQARGIGLEIANTAPGANVKVEKNIFTQSYAGSAFAAINLTVSNNQNNGQLAAGLNDLALSDNIVYKWERGVWLDPKLRNGGTGPYAVNNLSFVNNDFQEIKLTNVLYHGIAVGPTEVLGGNRYHLQKPGGAPVFMDGRGYDLQSWFSAHESSGQAVKANYVDPERTVNTYNFSLGGAGTNGDFLAKARGNSRTAFNPSYTASMANAYIRAGFVDAGDPTPAMPGGYMPPSDVPPSTGGTPVGPTPPPQPGTDGSDMPSPTLPPAPLPPASNPTPPTPTSPGYKTVVGSDGKIVIIWDEGSPRGSESTPPDEPEDEEPVIPDVNYTQPKAPGIQYQGGYWYI